MLSTKKITIITMLTLTSFSAATALDSTFFVQFNGGIADSKSEKVTATNNSNANNQKVKLGHSSIFELEAGATLGPNFTASVSLDYLPHFSKTNTQTINYNSYTGEVKDKSYLGTFNLYVNPFTFFDKVTPYIMGGIGYGSNSTKFTASGPTSSFTGSTIKNSNFVYKFGIGSKITFNPFFLDIRYQYMDLGKYTIGQSKNGNNVTSTLKANEFMIGAGYIF